MAEAMAEEEQPKTEQTKLDDEKRSNPSPRRSRSPRRENLPPAVGRQEGESRGLKVMDQKTKGQS